MYKRIEKKITINYCNLLLDFLWKGILKYQVLLKKFTKFSYIWNKSTFKHEKTKYPFWEQYYWHGSYRDFGVLLTIKEFRFISRCASLQLPYILYTASEDTMCH